MRSSIHGNIVIATFDDTNAALQGLREHQQLDDDGKLKLRSVGSLIIECASHPFIVVGADPDGHAPPTSNDAVIAVARHLLREMPLPVLVVNRHERRSKTKGRKRHD